MIDKGKYASHGSYIKRLSYNFLAKRDKPKLAIIHPLPATKPREPHINEQSKDMMVNSKTFSAKFRFQENIDRKPVTQQLVQPFLYIEKVIKKQRVDKQPVAGKIKKQKTKFVRKGPKQMPAVPSGFDSLYDYEQQRRRIANKVFQKLLECDIRSLKDMFYLWHGKSKSNNSDIDIKESEFIEFIKEILPGKISEKQIKHFFQLYKNKTPVGKQKDEQFRSISIKALAYNYEKYRKTQIEVTNIMSQKAAKERYIALKQQLTEFDKNYHSLKQAMNSIKNYQDSLKKHFQGLYNSYRNPYEEEISNLKSELQKPIIKYDKFKKQQLTSKIEAYTAKNNEIHQKLTEDYERFLENYEQAILPNHDLFFTKRTSDKLLRPLLQQYPYLTRELIQRKIAEQQTKKEQFLECLSDLVVELDRDKQYLGEDCFTLDEIVQLILMRGKKAKDSPAKFDDEFTLYSVKKLIKEIKKQFLLKNQLIVSSLDEFPSDQEINMEILHTCFEMECTKVLFKNQIWQELLAMIPQEETTSKLHQHTINANVCIQFAKRYFAKLDQRMDVQLNKSKQISLLAEDATIDRFSQLANIIDGVINSLGDYVEDEDQQKDTVEPLDRRRVKFADVVDSAYEKTNFPHKFKPEEPMQRNQEQIQRQREATMVKSLIKSIFEKQAEGKPNQLQQPLRDTPINRTANNFQDINTLAKSFYVPEGLNTNSFDIRYYQKVKEKQEKNRSHEPQIVRMGSSLLLSDLPHVEEIKSSDPLRISRFLMTNIDNGVKEEQRIVREKMLESTIKQGVGNNYYKDKIKLQNRPTIYDSEGKTKYSVLLPVGYYQNFVATENIPDKDKWYLRPHHVQTLTENPLSKKDNIIHSEYQSKLQKLPPKKRPDEYVIEQNVKRKEHLIEELEARIAALKGDLQHATRGSRVVQGAKVPPSIVDGYYSKLTENKEDKELQLASYQGVLYDLRRKQRQLLLDFREGQSRVLGQASEKWWQRKDKQFNSQLRKDRLLVADSLRPQQKHREYVDKLKNSQIY